MYHTSALFNACSVLWIMNFPPFPTSPPSSPYDGWHRSLQVFHRIISQESTYPRQPAVQGSLCQTHSYYTAAMEEWGWSGWVWGVRFADAKAQMCLLLDALAEHLESAWKETFGGQKKRPVRLPGKTRSYFPWCRGRCIINPSSEPSFWLSLCMACVGKECHLLLPQTKSRDIKWVTPSPSLALLPLRWPHTLPWLWLQFSRLTCMPTFALLKSKVLKQSLCVSLECGCWGHSWALVCECCSFIICVMFRFDSQSGCVLKLLLFIHRESGEHIPPSSVWVTMIYAWLLFFNLLLMRNTSVKYRFGPYLKV